MRLDASPANERLVAQSHEWSVKVHRILETPSSLVAFGVRADTPVVLKVVSGWHEEWNAGKVVAAFAGHGMVRALEHVPGAVLLEELRPGTPLSELVHSGRDRAATDIVVGVVAAMASTAPDVHGFVSAQRWAAGFDRYLAGDVRPLPQDLVTAGHHMYVELCRTQGATRLLHGDLQHYNILHDQERGWLAIDPKGVVAEPEFELAAVLRNPHGIPDLYTGSALARRGRQLAGGLGLDLERVLGWTFAQAVLSAIWSIEDGEVLQPDAPILGLARAARSLLA
jgi:streptomycin 6-kinase